MDVHTKEQRSYNMSRVKSKNTLPEKTMFKALRKAGIKFSKHNKKLPGKPDISIVEKKIAVFINGEFWHGKNFSILKKTIPQFWVEKIGKNIKRDRENYRRLSVTRWKIVKLWGRDVKKTPKKALEKILNLLN